MAKIALEVLTEHFEVCLSGFHFDMTLWVGPHLSTFKTQRRHTSSLSVYNHLDDQDYIIPKDLFSIGIHN